MSNETTLNEEKKMPGSVRAGYICIGLSILIVPIFLGLAGFVLGIVNASKGYIGHGVGQIILSVVCAYVGILFAIS